MDDVLEKWDGFVVAGEIIRIHGYLAAAPRLRYIEGASLLLEVFSNRVVPALAKEIEPGNNLVVAGAARYLLVFKNGHNAMHFLELVRHYADTIFGPGRLVQCGPFEIAKVKNEKELLEMIRESLEEAKHTLRDTDVPQKPNLQFMERCQACGNWGAEYPDNEDEWLCGTCNYRLCARNGKEIEIDLAPTVQGLPGSPQKLLIATKGNSSKDKIIAIYPKREQSRYKDFHKMAEKDPSGYLGLFYADGNSMGKLFSGCNTLSEYQKLSNNIGLKNDSALDAAMNEVIDTKGFPGAVLIKGGDDLLVVLPASKAVVFASKYLEEVITNGTPFKEGVCGGLVLSPRNLPFTAILKRAEELLKSAKRQVWSYFRNESDPARKSAVDFSMVSSPMLLPVQSLPERRAYLADQPGKYYLPTARPYLPSEFEKLVKRLMKFNKEELPRGVMMALKEIFVSGELDGSRVDDKGKFLKFNSMIKRQIALRPKKEKSINDIFHKQLLMQEEWKAFDADGTERESLRTWQADMVELIDFIEA